MVAEIGLTVAKAVGPPAIKWAFDRIRAWTNAPSELPDAETTDACATWFAEQLDRDASWQAVQSYLLSPEYGTVVRSLLLLQISGRAPTYLQGATEQTAAGLRFYGMDEALAEPLTELTAAFVDVVVQKCGLTTRSHREAVAKAAESSSIETHLVSIERRMARLGQAERVDEGQLNDGLNRYMTSARRAFGRIQPPDTEGAELVPIDKLYVAPTLTLNGETQLSVDVLSARPRTVVVGDPGGGKTTLTRKIAHDLLTARASDKLSPIPIVVVLREFGIALRKRSQSVAEYISETFRQYHQVDLPVSAIEWCLNNGRFLMVFDGLDELLQTESRRQIAQIIDSFEAVYPDANILVTSRRVGYYQAPLDRETFDVVELGEFVEEQTAQYVRKWFSAQPKMSETEAAKISNEFMRDSNTVADLRRNPLMLALMCSIYRSESYIPRNRPEVYEKCSRMLFDKWDRHRNLFEPLEFEAHIEPALMHIAHLLYVDPDAQGGVSEEKLVAWAADYLEEWQFDNRPKAEFAAAQFVQFCRGRAWVFTDVGLDARESSLYHFTHRTFLEYFTACHIARRDESVSEFCERIYPMLAANEGDVVYQLAIQVKTKTVRGGADSAVDRLVGKGGDLPSESHNNVLAFLARCTAFLITSPRTSKQLVDACWSAHSAIYDGYIANDKAANDEKSVQLEWWGDDGSDVSSSFKNLLNPLTRAAREVRPIMSSRLLERSLERIDSKESAEFAAAVAWSLLSEDHPPEAEVHYPEGFIAAKEKLLAAMRKNDWVWAKVGLHYSGELEFSELLSTVGHFATVWNSAIPGISIRYVPPAAYYNRLLLSERCAKHSHSSCLGGGHYHSIAEISECLIAAASFCLENPPGDGESLDVVSNWLIDSDNQKPVDQLEKEPDHEPFTAQALEAGLFLILLCLELESPNLRPELAASSRKLGHFNAVKDLLDPSSETIGTSEAAKAIRQRVTA